MNLVNSAEEETKTIKYLNKNGSEQDENSESATERQIEEELRIARKIFHPPKSHLKQHKDSKPNNCRIVVVETLENYGHQKIQPNGQVPAHKPKHKKGKSMDLEELFTNEKEESKGRQKIEGAKEKSKRQHSRQYNMDLKERKSNSEMKHYHQVSKKISAHKSSNQGQHNFKKKKSKTIKSGEIKSLKKEMRKFIEDTPIYIQRKRKSDKQVHKKDNHLPKNIKSYSKSMQIFGEKPQKRNSYKEINSEEFRDIAYSMPMTSKIIHLLSNNSSVYNSQKELEILNNNRSYVIPTEQSVPQIQEIRAFEHTILRKSSSERFKHTRRPTPITNLIEQEVEESLQSTENIIKKILHKLEEADHSAHINSLDKEMEQISYIPYENSIKDRNLDLPAELMGGSVNAGTFQEISQCQSIKLDSEEGQESSEVREKQEQIKKLDNIISELSKNNQKIEKKQKDNILNKIKGLIGFPSPLTKQEEKIEQQESNQDQSNLDLTNSELKSSFALETDMSQLNLQMLDQALREREAYLAERKERELQKLQQLYEESDLAQQKQKIIKWIQHEIKSVVHTRHQLWKGFNVAKDLLEGKEEQSAIKKKTEMMKSLSQKYLHRQLNNKRRKEKKSQDKAIQKEEVRQKAEESSQSNDQRELGEGRINDVDREALEKTAQSEVRVSYHLEQSQEQLLSQTKPLSDMSPGQFHDPPLDEQSSQSDYEYDRNNILNQPVQFSSSVDNTPVNVSESPGLNIKQIECDIDYENSFNQEDLQDLAKQGQKIREQSMKLPFDLSVQDKQDIYEFIFLDLCVELTDEYSLESPVIKKIFHFIKGVKEQSKKQKGFKTNTNIIKEYLFQFISFLKAKADHLHEVYTNLDKPLGPTALDILKYMHACDDDLGEDQTNETVFILDIKLFQQFQMEYLNKIAFETYYQEEEKQKKRRAFLKNAIHIHNKAIFDALNETLDKERPFGVWGQPFSWKKTPKFYHQRDTNTKNSIMLKSAQKTIEYGAYMCGFMIDKEECTLKSNPNISQAYIEQIRDDRLSRMLANDLDQSEEKMLFIDDEETEILVEVSHLIYQSLLQEMCRNFASILL